MSENEFRIDQVGQTVDLTDRPDITGLVLTHPFVEGCCEYEEWRHVFDDTPARECGTFTIGPIAYEATKVEWKP